MYWSFPELVAYASRGTELRAGDVIGSGTVGTGCIADLASTHGSERYPWLSISDEVELTVAHLGTLHGRIVEGDELRPLR